MIFVTMLLWRWR